MTLTVCWAFAGLTAPTGLFAQRLSGLVREAASGSPITGAVVSAIDSAGHVTARTITDQNGRYVVSGSVAAARVRVVHIGYRPATLTLLVSSTVDTTVDVVMERLPVQLEAIHVSSDAICDGSATARAALDLWQEARLALLSAIVAREAKPARVSTLTYERRYSLRDSRITQQQSRLGQGVTDRPFQARPAADLAAHGYRLRGVDDIYYAPDADVLLDDTFSESHCFGVQMGDGIRTGQVGLAFSPRSRSRRDSIVDVTGVLWLDPKASSLIQLDYRYTAVDAAAQHAGAGGSIHFQGVANGVTFIDEWTVLLPVVKTIRGTGASGERSVTTIVTDLSESGGVTIDARWDDGTQWHTRRIGVVLGRVVEHGTAIPVPGVEVAITGTAHTVADSVGRYAFGFLPRGRYGLETTDTAFFSFLPARMDRRDVDVTGDSVVMDLEVTSRSSLIASLCGKMEREQAVLLGEVADGTGTWPGDLRVEGSWQDDFIKTKSGGLAVSERKTTIDVDNTGHFRFCGVPRGRPIQLRVLIDRRQVADSTLRPAFDSVRTVKWSLPPLRSRR